uniref:Lysine transporter LysE n=1 Tax=candidate division WOR-3 bacterium TaxID=2052148 RepID=A0A7C6ECE8_UNCW3
MIGLLFKVVVISTSGALAPGPLTAAIASVGLKKGFRAGIQASLGHTIIELPLVILIALGVTTILKNPKANFVIGISGSIFLFLFGILTIRDALSTNPQEPTIYQKTAPPMLIGIALTGLNPYFIVWWLGIGTPLISEAVAKGGFIGVGLLYLCHVWLDYGWLTLIAAISSLGRMQTKIYRLILIVLGTIIIWFGVNMLVKTISFV